MWKWDASSLSLALEAVRAIEEGEEITIQYVDCTLGRDKRREQLLSMYNFECHCVHCDLPTSAGIGRSDLARQELRQIWKTIPSFEKWCHDPRLPDDLLIRAHQGAMELRDKEGLHLFDYRKHVDAIAMCYGAMRDVQMFKWWARKAKKLRGESDIDQIIVLDLWLKNPECFPVWGWRRHRA